ncbi:MAG: hypothetical protein IPO92_19085 [Saprospiraceae bacterium]|nr:hypothetical protein [Saprospiraceae bacterium]
MKRKKYFNDYIAEHPFVKKIIEKSKVYSFPGFQGIPLFDVVTFVIKETQKDNLTTRANSITFRLFLSIFFRQ